jgi:hypothetical protein
MRDFICVLYPLFELLHADIDLGDIRLPNPATLAASKEYDSLVAAMAGSGKHFDI